MGRLLSSRPRKVLKILRGPAAAGEAETRKPDTEQRKRRRLRNRRRVDRDGTDRAGGPLQGPLRDAAQAQRSGEEHVTCGEIRVDVLEGDAGESSVCAVCIVIGAGGDRAGSSADPGEPARGTTTVTVKTED